MVLLPPLPCQGARTGRVAQRDGDRLVQSGKGAQVRQHIAGPAGVVLKNGRLILLVRRVEGRCCQSVCCCFTPVLRPVC